MHIFQIMGCDTGIDLEALLTLAQRMRASVGHPVPGQVVKAGPSTRRYPIPEGLGSVQTHQRPFLTEQVSALHFDDGISLYTRDKGAVVSVRRWLEQHGVRP